MDKVRDCVLELQTACNDWLNGNSDELLLAAIEYAQRRMSGVVEAKRLFRQMSDDDRERFIKELSS